MTSENTSLVGRKVELSGLRDLVTPPHEESRALLILGDPGMGKTVLLAEAVRAARRAGMRVLAAPAGSRSGTWRSPGCISCCARCWTAWTPAGPAGRRAARCLRDVRRSPCRPTPC